MTSTKASTNVAPRFKRAPRPETGAGMLSKSWEDVSHPKIAPKGVGE